MGKERTTLSNNLDSARNEMQVLKEKLEGANLERASLQEEKVDLMDRISTIQEEIKDREVKQHNLEQICAKLEGDLKSSQKSLADLNDIIVIKESSLAEKQEQLEFLLREEHQVYNIRYFESFVSISKNE